MGTLNKIVFPLIPGFKTPFLTPETQDLFDGDDLVIVVDRENYNAPNNISKEVLIGLGTATVDRLIDYYELEAVCFDARETIKDVLFAIAAAGNLDSQGLAGSPSVDTEPLVIIHDYHRFDTSGDRAAGFTERVGVLNPEDIKGSFRAASGDNHNNGIRINFTHTNNLVGATLVDAISGM